LDTDAGMYNLSCIGDFVWFDTNINGIQDVRIIVLTFWRFAFFVLMFIFYLFYVFIAFYVCLFYVSLFSVMFILCFIYLFIFFQTKQGGETGITGINVTLSFCNGTVVGTTVTPASG
jgi:hypothetical protein